MQRNGAIIVIFYEKSYTLHEISLFKFIEIKIYVPRPI